jgi:hypothetical protein
MSTQTDLNWPTNHGEIDEAPEFGYPIFGQSHDETHAESSLRGELQHFQLLTRPDMR